MLNSIKHWPEQERPRERLLEKGADALSDAELLAIFLRTGYKDHSAVEVARQMILHFGGLRQIIDAPIEEIMAFKGIGKGKYALLMASKALAQRYLQQQLQQDDVILNQSDLIVAFLKSQLRHQPQELFAIMLLNPKYQLMKYDVIFKGTFQQCQVSTQDIVRQAISQKCTLLIAVHNHPQGHALPSPEDLIFTEKLKNACELLDLQLLDHFIISQNEYFSFAEQGLM